MRSLAVVLAIAVVLGTVPRVGHGAVLHVERDGTGDFTTIADAMNAAAVGDTILLGPGRYTEFAPFTTSGWTEDTYAAVTVDSLTLMGVDRDAVIIGPLEPDVVGAGPKGVVTADTVTALRLENITVESVREGAYLLGHVSVWRCRFSGNVLGVVAFTDELIVQDCDFLSNDDMGIFTGTGTGVLLLEECRFIDNVMLGAGIARTQHATVRRCEFRGSRGGVQLSEGTVGDIVACTFSQHDNGGVILLGHVDGRVDGCVIDTMPYNIWTVSGSTLRGEGNVLRGGSFATLRFWSNSTVSGFQNNDILKGDGPSVRAEGYVTVPIDIDLTNNYWGTTEPDSIAAWVVDGNDLHVPVIDPNFSNVIFEPFLLRSIPTKTESVGSLKARYDDHK